MKHMRRLRIARILPVAAALLTAAFLIATALGVQASPFGGDTTIRLQSVAPEYVQALGYTLEKPDAAATVSEAAAEHSVLSLVPGEIQEAVLTRVLNAHRPIENGRLVWVFSYRPDGILVDGDRTFQEVAHLEFIDATSGNYLAGAEYGIPLPQQTSRRLVAPGANS
jgi:hypothetical protein